MNGIVEQVRRRLEEARARVGIKPILRGQTEPLIGGGRVIEQVKARTEEITRRLAERRPNIIPKVAEQLKGWKLGEKVKMIVETPSEAKPETPRVTETETKKGGFVLRH